MIIKVAKSEACIKPLFANLVTYTYYIYIYNIIYSIHTVYTVILIFTVSCPSLMQPNNGMMNCSLGDDNIISYEDTCNFRCTIGYELSDNDIRICQGNGSWSGIEPVCRRSMYLDKDCILISPQSLV